MRGALLIAATLACLVPSHVWAEPPPAPLPLPASPASAPAPGPAAPGSDAPPRLALPYLGPEVSTGVSTRVSSSSAYERDQIADINLAAGLWYRAAHYALGAQYRFIGLGSGRSRDGVNDVEASYDAHTLWVSGRLTPYEAGGYGIFVGANVGLVFMHQSASGVRTLDFDDPAGAPFLCSATDTPNLGLGVAAGLSADVGDRMAFIAQGGASMLRGTSGVIDGCVPGLGSPVTLDALLGFAVYFGV